MKDSRFDGFGDPTPTHYGDPVPYGDFYAAATGADDELTAVEPRRHDELPRLVIEFRDTASRQTFITELLLELKKHPLPDRKPAWRHVARWNCGEGQR